MSQSIEKVQEAIEGEFALFDDWTSKYEYLIDLGRELPPIDEQHKTEEHIIKGCQSRVWLHADYRNGRLWFTADSDAVITRGLVALVVRVFNGQAPADIAHASMDFIDRIGLRAHLSPTRSNGLQSMIRQIKSYALAYNTLSN